MRVNTKDILYMLKWPLILLLIGFLVRVFGAMIKILHWVGADLVLITGTVLMMIAIVWLIIKISLLKKTND
jgi:hypothetical protein